MTHSFPFEQFQRDTRLRRRSDHGCLPVKGKKADETPGTKETRQGLWGAQAVTCIVLLPSFSPLLSYSHSEPFPHRDVPSWYTIFVLLFLGLPRPVPVPLFATLSCSLDDWLLRRSTIASGGFPVSLCHRAACLITLGQPSAIEMFN